MELADILLIGILISILIGNFNRNRNFVEAEKIKLLERIEGKLDRLEAIEFNTDKLENINWIASQYETHHE
tara:strand:- start:258 stop:470 length:213 start_codon:yes stop_codon:yes gene_type:complete